MYCLISKDVEEEQILEVTAADIEFWRSRVADRRICVVSAFNPSYKTSREQTEVAAKIMAELFHATVVINDSFLGKAVLKMFLVIKGVCTSPCIRF
jgi:hypothetical protein